MIKIFFKAQIGEFFRSFKERSQSLDSPAAHVHAKYVSIVDLLTNLIGEVALAPRRGLFPGHVSTLPICMALITAKAIQPAIESTPWVYSHFV